MEYRQFLAEFYLNLKHQGFEFGSGSIAIIFEIWMEYLYQICPNYAILVDPKIIDQTRKINLNAIHLRGREI